MFDYDFIRVFIDCGEHCDPEHEWIISASSIDSLFDDASSDFMAGLKKEVAAGSVKYICAATLDSGKLWAFTYERN